VRCQRTRLPADRRGVDPRYPVLETRLLAGAQSICFESRPEMKKGRILFGPALVIRFVFGFYETFTSRPRYSQRTDRRSSANGPDGPGHTYRLRFRLATSCVTLANASTCPFDLL
jgi:hypothetical protein